MARSLLSFLIQQRDKAIAAILLRDRDASYGSDLPRPCSAMAIEEVVTAPRSPWQNAYIERIIGSIRRECLDHVIIFDERQLRRVLSAYFEYHHRSRTHLSLAKDCPEPRPIQPPSAGPNLDHCRGAGRRRRPQLRARVQARSELAPMRSALFRIPEYRRWRSSSSVNRTHGRMEF
jgi:transposase InsO family protein